MISGDLMLSLRPRTSLLYSIKTVVRLRIFHATHPSVRPLIFDKPRAPSV